MVNPTLYLLFLGIAVPTVLTPGPGVLMSLTNSIRLGVPRATPGIIGVVLGTLMIAALSATGLGVILAASPTAYNVIKLAGMVFMLYLGWKRFNANPNFLRVVNYTGRKEQGAPEAGPLRLFGEGIVLQLSNPQLIIFYLSLFPQCIDDNKPYWPQFVFLSLSYTLLVWIIHSCYGWMGHKAAERFMTQKNCIWINRISGIAFWLCALWLLYSLVAG